MPMARVKSGGAETAMAGVGKRIATMVAALLAGAGAARAVEVERATCPPKISDHGKVAQVIDGDTVRLADGRQVRLVGMQAPKLSLGRASVKDWPLSQEAKAALEKLALGREVGLGFGGEKIDRNGRTLAHLVVEGANAWVQGEMISAGMARVYTWPDNRACATELLAREGEARAAKRGIWALSYYRIRAPLELAQEIDTFQVVEGRVAAAAEVRGRLFLNFGKDYREDFTVTIAPQDMKPFRAIGFDPRTLVGQRIRVRGWVSLSNGPEIEATHPEQIEIVKPAVR